MPIEGAQAHSAGRARFLGIDFDLMEEEAVLAELARREGGGFRYLVTPNVDHVVTLFPRREKATTPAYRAAYAAAARRLCDSKVLARLARMKGVALPVCAGSDLTARLFRELFRAGDKVAIIGGDEAMLAELNQRFLGPDYVQHIPPMGVLAKPDAVEAILTFMEREKADFTLFAIGAPQSEIIAHKAALRPGMRGTGLCVGASIEFVLGRKARAPLWMRTAGIEWAHRLLTEPRRLWKRYLVHGPRVFLLTLQDRRGNGAA